jgi:hypothetical protein
MREGGRDDMSVAGPSRWRRQVVNFSYLTLPTRIFPQIPTVYVGVRWYQFREMVILNLIARLWLLEFCHRAIRPGAGDHHVVVVASAAMSSHRRPSCRVPRPSSSCIVVVVARPRHLHPGKAGAATNVIVVGRFDRSSSPSMTSTRSQRRRRRR